MAEQPQDTPLSTERTMIRKALEQAHRDKALAARLPADQGRCHARKPRCGPTCGRSWPRTRLGCHTYDTPCHAYVWAVS
jgi:hypothetical protein